MLWRISTDLLPMSPRLLLAAAMLLFPAVHAQEPGEGPRPEQLAAHLSHTGRVASALAREGGPRELALAALLREVGMRQGGDDDATRARDPQAQAWSHAAASGAGDDVAAHRLLVAAAPADDPVRREAARRGQAVEPGNLVPLLHAGLTVDALLAQARATSRADSGMYADVRWIAAAMRRHPPTAAEQAAMTAGQPFHGDESAAVFAMALWSARALPGYAPLVEACSERMLRALPARREDCRHVAILLADHSTSLADEHAGLAMLRALAATPGEREQLQARQRRMDWRMLQWGRLVREQPRDGAGQFARLLADASLTSEQQLVDRVLAEGGVAADPPPGWQPPRR